MSAKQQTPRALGYRMPAEWEPHAATWLCWPHHATDWPGKKAAIPWVFAEFARLLTRGEALRLIVEPQERERARRTLVRAGVEIERVSFLEARTNRSWTRDTLPIGVVTRDAPRGCQRATRGKPGRVAGVKFRFNGWARYRDHEHDEAAGQRVAQSYDRSWKPRVEIGGVSRRVVLEGGAIDTDGQGTLLATEQCLLGTRFARNPGLGRAGIEAALSDYLGIDRVLWLPDGIAGDDTSGHVDDFCRFVRPGTVVICDEPRGADENHRPLAAAQERLAGLKDARRRTLEVVKLPMPEPVRYGDLRLPASYANFYVCNAGVLVPTFNDPADQLALGILGELFDDRPVVGVYARDLVLGLGTLHCSSQQVPAA